MTRQPGLFGDRPRNFAPQPKPAAGKRAIHVSAYGRKSRDFYATPAWVTEALLRHISFRGPVWEPCCGTGAMSAVLAAHGYDILSTDIADRGFGTPGVDFLQQYAFKRNRLSAGSAFFINNLEPRA